MYWDLMTSLNYRTVRSRLKSILCSAEVAYSLVKSHTIDECCNGHSNGIEALHDTAQFAPSCACILQKMEHRIIDMAEWRMLIGLNVLWKVGLMNLGGN